MGIIATQSPLPQYFDLNGHPLDEGYLYFGAANQNPEVSPVTVYWDAAGAQPAAQPIRTLNGYAFRYGVPAAIFVSGDYSLTVKDKRGALIFYGASATYYSNAANLQTAAGAGNVGYDFAQSYSAGSVGSELKLTGLVVDSIAALKSRVKTGNPHVFVTGYYAPLDGGGGAYWLDTSDTTSVDNGGTIIVASDGGRWKLILTGAVSVKQFGAKGNYTGSSITGQNDTAPIQAAISWAEANINSGTYGSYSPSVGTGVVYFPQGSFGVNAALVATNKVCILGEGQTEFTFGSRLTQTAANTDLFKISAGAGSASFSIENMVLRSNTLGAGTGHLVNMVRSGGGAVNSQRYVNCTFSQPQAMALYLGGDDIVIKNCLFDVSQQSGDFIQLGTAAQGAGDVRIEGCDFFNPTNSAIKLINIVGLVVNGNILSQPNSSTRTPYFIDGITTPPTLAKDIAISGNTIRGPRTFVGLSGATDVTITGNTVVDGGIGAGESQDMLKFSGVAGYVTIAGNTLRGAYDARHFYDDSGMATTLNGRIADNTFLNDGGAGDALSCAKFVGRIGSNAYAGFSNQQVGQKKSTTGTPVNLGNITTLAQNGYQFTVPGAAFGDTVGFGTINNAWIAPIGIDVRGFVVAANTVRIEYRNTTGGTINVPAHDIWTEVTR